MKYLLIVHVLFGPPYQWTSFQDEYASYEDCDAALIATEKAEIAKPGFKAMTLECKPLY